MECGALIGFVDYAPDFEFGEFDNRKAKKDEMILVKVHGLSYGEQQEYRSRVAIKGNEKKGFKTNSRDVDFKMFIDNVKDLRNIEIKGKPCTSPGQLFKEGMPELVTDIVKALQDMSHLKEGDIKNFTA